MSLLTETIWCTGCGVEISWGPFYVYQRPYCCEECAHGLPCQCAERMELDDDLRIPKSPIMPP
jgi:hypothetical protein